MLSTFDLALILLAIQGAIGAFDVLYNHEWDARLPSQSSAWLELRIHSIRAVLYALVFMGIAWFNWLGEFVWLFALLIFIEIALTLWDFVVEDQTRKLSPLERVVHTILAMNGGAYVVLLLHVMFTDWVLQPAALQFIDRGWISLLLSMYGIGVFLSGVRDGIASYKLERSSSRQVSLRATN